MKVLLIVVVLALLPLEQWQGAAQRAHVLLASLWLAATAVWSDMPCGNTSDSSRAGHAPLPGTRDPGQPCRSCSGRRPGTGRAQAPRNDHSTKEHQRRLADDIDATVRLEVIPTGSATTT
ncbi:hypothetical protein [Streptomyces sp. NRRL S-244]|uniref:hypothetical protein n=1 Tax=Streptomyces sp. NRRL S-244 TaxID=1463897 RepID=UPI0004C152E4|nr:hypothetical protein [Streptomyces sp. NRRL S-244]